MVILVNSSKIGWVYATKNFLFSVSLFMLLRDTLSTHMEMQFMEQSMKTSFFSFIVKDNCWAYIWDVDLNGLSCEICHQFQWFKTSRWLMHVCKLQMYNFITDFQFSHSLFFDRDSSIFDEDCRRFPLTYSNANIGVHDREEDVCWNDNSSTVEPINNGKVLLQDQESFWR